MIRAELQGSPVSGNLYGGERWAVLRLAAAPADLKKGREHVPMNA
jgi:hypothetical protein